MSHDLSLFSNEEHESSNKGVYLGNATRIPVALTGEVHMELQTEEGQGNLVVMKNVLGVEGLAKNLFSVSACLSHGFNITFQATPRLCKITKTTESGELHMRRKDFGSLTAKAPLPYIICCQRSHQPEPMDKFREWHNRMGHLNYDSLKMLVSKRTGKKDLTFPSSDSFRQKPVEPAIRESSLVYLFPSILAPPHLISLNLYIQIWLAL